MKKRNPSYSSNKIDWMKDQAQGSMACTRRGGMGESPDHGALEILPRLTEGRIFAFM